jgi:redox-sensitive bicupin YhaK (pirin superfamily)
MMQIRRGNERGHLNHGWLDTYHTFSFGDYYDRNYMGYRSLRVINEDYVAPGRGFGMHPHRDMEILTYVLEGRLEHRDSLGNGAVIRPGIVQYMSAGSGIRHSEFNPSPDEPVHLMQIWIEPREHGAPPRYEERAFGEDGDGLRLIASPDGRDGSIAIRQDARVLAGRLTSGRDASLTLDAERHAWVQVLQGGVHVNGADLAAGDAAAISGEQAVALRADDDAEVLVFDLT